MPRNFYQGKTRVTIRAVFTPSDSQTVNGNDIRSAVAEYTVDAASTTTDTSFNNNINSIIQSVAEGRDPFVASSASMPTYLACFGLFLIIGLFVASMYYSGKSPVSLLDITTPKIPGPKGVTAGGQILAPFGYTEMKRVTKDQMGANVAALSEMSNRFATGMRNNASLNQLSSAINRIPVSAADADAKDPNPKGFARALVVGGLRAGLTQAELAPPTNTLPYHYKDSQHRVANRIFQALEEMGGREKLYASLLRDYLHGVRTFQSLEVLTAHPDIAQRSRAHYALTSRLGMFFGAQRYAILGGMVMSGTDSMFRSGRVVGRLVKGAATEAPNLARAITKTTIGAVGGQRALDRLEAAARESPSSTAAFVQNQISRAPNAISVGQMTPLIGKMEHLYSKLRDEVYRDQMSYVLRQFYRSKGINFDMSLERMATMGHLDMDILRESGFSRLTAIQRAEIAAAEERFRTIFANASFTPAQKLEALRDFAASHGAHIDNNALLFTQRVEAVGASAQPDYMKMVSLYQILESQHATAAAAVSRASGADAYVCHVGSTSLPEHSVWGALVTRSMVWDGENGHLNGGIAQELVAGRLKTANRLATLDPTAYHQGNELPEHMRTSPAASRALVERNKSELTSLLTDEGRTMLSTFLKGRGKTTQTASVADLVEFMYGGTMPRGGAVVDQKSGYRAEYDRIEAGLPAKATLVDLKGRWSEGSTDRDLTAIGAYTHARFTRSYVPFADAAIEAALNRNPAHTTWSVEQRAAEAKKLLVVRSLREDAENRFNSLFANNAYGNTTHETVRYYSGLVAGVLAEAMERKGLPANHPDLRFVEEGNFSDPKRIGRLRDLMGQYQKEIAAAEGRSVNYDEIHGGKRAMVMNQEGGYSYYVHGQTLSTGDRIYGDVVMRDAKGVKRQFAVENVAIRFNNNELERGFAEVRDAKDPATWTGFMNRATAWVNERTDPEENYRRRQVFAGVLHNFANTTNVYQSEWHGHSTVEVIPKQQASLAAPSVLGLVGQDSTFGKAVADRVMKPARDIGLHIGHWISRVALVGAGSLLTTSYDIAAISAFQRVHGMKMMMQIYSGDLPSDLSEKERSLLNTLAVRYSRWKQVHDWTVDRNPWRESSSYGSGQSYEAKFNMGPRRVPPTEAYLGAYYNRAEWRNMMWGPYGGTMNLAAKALQPLQSMIGQLQMSMQGYPSSWDSSGSPLRNVDHTDVRFLEALSGLNPLNHTTNKYLRSLNVWESSTERRQLAGKAFLEGLTAGPQHVNHLRKGIYTNVREGGWSPSYLHGDYRMETYLDPAMAEYAFRAKETLYLYDQKWRDQAMNNTMRRTVAAEELAIKRRQELASYGITTNPLFGWATPIAFAWHLPFPLVPQSLTPRDLTAKALEKSRGGRGGGVWSAIEGMGRGAYEGTARLLQPRTASKIVYCPYCKTSNFRGTECKNPLCRKPNY